MGIIKASKLIFDYIRHDEEEKDGNNSDTADESCNSLRKAHSSKLIYFIGFTSAEEKISFSGIMTKINLKIGGINIFTVLKF